MFPLLSPATTWALVATSPGPTTKPDPSCSLLHAVPRILTVENTAGSPSDARLGARRRGHRGRRRRGEGREDLGEPLVVQEGLQVVEDRRCPGQHPVDGVEDVGTGHRGVEGGEAAVGRGDHGRHQPDGEQDGHDRYAHAEDGIDVTQVVSTHGDVAPGAQDAAGVAEGTGRQHDERHDDDGAGGAFVAVAQQGYPHQGPEEEPEEEASKGEELDQRAKSQSMDGSQEHQPDDQEIHPVHRLRG